MKKVRLAIGTAVPAAGMLMIPAAAHAATTKPTPPPGATTHHGRAHATTAFTCPPASGTSVAASANGELFGFISFNNSCVDFQQATLTHRQSGLTERLRVRNVANQVVKEAFLGGTQIGGSTFWWSSPNVHGVLVCQALVQNGNHNHISYGPVCEVP